jgi:hypothetical protein
MQASANAWFGEHTTELEGGITVVEGPCTLMDQTAVCTPALLAHAHRPSLNVKTLTLQYVPVCVRRSQTWQKKRMTATRRPLRMSQMIGMQTPPPQANNKHRRRTTRPMLQVVS